MAEPDKIDLVDDVIMVAVRIVRQTFRVSLSAIVSGYSRDISRAAVDFGARFLGTDRSVRDEPPVADLPVITPRGGGYGVYFDFREGDLGVVLCQDSPVRGLYETGDPVVPQWPQGHDLGCGVIFPGGRVSSTDTPTLPPNAEGTLLVGADDGSAAVVFRGAGLPDPAELGTVVIAAAGPAASVLLGGNTATLGVVRLGDDVSRNAAMITWMTQVTTAINGLAPGAVTPFVQPAIGVTSSASTKVVSE